MREIDEIRIEGEENGWHLVIHTDEGTERYRIGLPDQFAAEVERTIGEWLDQGERLAGRGVDMGAVARLEAFSRGEPYDHDDPKGWPEPDGQRYLGGGNIGSTSR